RPAATCASWWRRTMSPPSPPGPTPGDPCPSACAGRASTPTARRPIRSRKGPARAGGSTRGTSWCRGCSRPAPRPDIDRRAKGRRDLPREGTDSVVQRVEIYDVTHRDGAQGPRVKFSADDQLRIIKELDDFGVSYIEGGQPGSNPKAADLFAR